jgi:uncharacterized cupin superfamily protein
MKNDYKWRVEFYKWGQIGRLKEEYRENNKIKHTAEGYWPFGIFVENEGNKKILLSIYKWGQIGRLKEEYRENNKIKHTAEGYWPFGIFVENEGNKKLEEYKLEKKEIYANLAKTEDFEFKYWEFKAGEKSHEPKVQRNATEYNFIIEGQIRGRVDDKDDIFLEAGDYIIINPGFVINLQKEVIKDTKGITIKIPSIQNDTIKKSRFDNF